MATTSKAANMDVPISQTDIGYLYDAAEKIFNQKFYYISYMLLEEAGKLLETLKEQGSTEYTEGLESGIRDLLSLTTEKGTIKDPDGYAGKTTIGKLVLFYSEYKKMYQIDWLRISSANFDPELKGEYETREYILTTSKALRTALKMLSRVARGNTPEEVFIRENEIPEEFLQDTEYDEEGSSETYGLPAEANMDVPFSKIDIEYLIDAAENTTFASIPEYVPYILFEEAQKALENMKKQVSSETKELESRISKGLSSITEAQKMLEKQDPAKYAKELKFPIREGLSSITEAQKMLEKQDPVVYTKELEFHISEGLSSITVAQKRLEKQDPTEYTKKLESRISKGLSSITEAQKTLEKQKELEDRILIGLSVITDKGINIPKRPEDYKANESIIQVLAQLYSKYNEDNKIDELYEEDKKHKWGILSAKFQELEGRSAKRERILTTSKVLRNALKTLYRVAREKEFTQIKIPKEFLHDDEAYNIIPFDVRTKWLPAEVVETIQELNLAGAAMFPTPLEGDVLDSLQFLFKFQESSVSNQRENIGILLSNEQMRLGELGPVPLGEHGRTYNEALENVFRKTLANYIRWCNYLNSFGERIFEPIWNNMDVISNERKIRYISLYYLIWGEAANVRFLPECLCYIFHHMSRQVDDYLIELNGEIEQVPLPLNERPFIDEVIQPLYDVIAAEAQIKERNSDVPHSEWRNYDDFNEYFWSPNCLQLGWPLNIDSPFFQRPREGSTVYGKTSFVERRTFLHIYHSFHRMWIFHVIMFQVLAIVAFNDEKLNAKTLREILVVGPTYFLMKLTQSMLDIWLKDGAYSNIDRADVSRIRFRIIRFRASCLLLTLIIYFMKSLQEKTSSVEESIAFYACIVVLVIYACTITWINQLEMYAVRFMDERLLESYLREEYVGRDMGEKYIDIFWYTIFWIVTLAINFAFTYYGLIKYLVPTRDITDHVSKNIPNMLAIGSLWVGVICAYIAGSHVSYNVTSAVVGTYIVGRWDNLGEIKSLGDVRKCFGEIPRRIMDRLNREPENNHVDVNLIAEGFSSFWNNIVKHLREEDNISDLEQYALSMPDQSERINVIQWPPFLLVGKVSGAIKIAAKRVPQEVMWNEITSDVYMRYAVQECFYSVEFILSSILDVQWREWVERIYRRIRQSIEARNLHTTFQLNRLADIIKEISEFTEALEQESRPHEPRENLPQERRHFEDRRRAKNRARNARILRNGAERLYHVIQSDFLRQREAQRREFSDFKLPTDHPELSKEVTS